MLARLRRWREKRALATLALPDALWDAALDALPFLDMYDEAMLARLRERVVLFLAQKSIVGANDFEVTPLMRAVIAVQACVLVLNLDPAWYDGWENVVVYPDEFVPRVEFTDDAGVVHPNEQAFAGEALSLGPVLLSWPDVAASADWRESGMNLVIHEFAHKLDMRDGDANGCPPLPPHIAAAQWASAMQDAYERFVAVVDSGEEPDIDPYAADSPAEFFAVLSEVFFSEPELLMREYDAVYRLFARFYGQDPARYRRERSSHR